VTSERRRWTEHPLVQLTLVRYREFYREPEAVFWVFVFPVLLTAGLGIAFRNQAPERTPVAVVTGAAARTASPPRSARATRCGSRR
jgi:ABC-2 type transport system permease protein